MDSPFSRRAVLAGGLAVTAAPAIAAQPRPDVVGAGVFGAWTAARLQAAGQRVLLLDAWGPAHARASSGGESRMTRAVYGGAEIYTRMALESLPEWQALSNRAALPLFHPMGVLMFFAREHPYAAASLALHRKLGLPTRALDAAELRRAYPQVDWSGVTLGLLEPRFGALMARRAVQTLVDGFVRRGGEYRVAAILPPAPADKLEAVATSAGERIVADRWVFACGPWLPRMFPDLLAARIFPTRQEIFFFAPPEGDRRFGPAHLPGWADFNEGDIYYGFPDLEARGFKIAADRHGLPIDPDLPDRTPSPEGLADVRAYMARRFPALARAPLNEARVCQYENSSNGDLLIDRHPRWPNVVLVGAGSGHGFKHGPAVGRRAAALLLDPSLAPEPRFSLATKARVQARAVH